MTKKIKAVAKHRLVLLLKRRRLEWVLGTGVLTLAAYLRYHEEIYKVVGELLALPAMEALMARIAELE